MGQVGSRSIVSVSKGQTSSSIAYLGRIIRMHSIDAAYCYRLSGVVSVSVCSVGHDREHCENG